ncbi:hypothetical protein VB780_03130 [Leptolyngbya sp. CCNP1308]|uniref:hypothetical protein n=1 Tax=Leptolyngbya sp. CCNP1308 TaxID=3110255 RepID=UPI002B21BF3D|nr:hypothetical protein [Leptolyngbya sp. CCNP1308]MEA5447547.1 hypothetical protein [Leptolyngbya sp. CCNP1308]
MRKIIGNLKFKFLSLVVSSLTLVFFLPVLVDLGFTQPNSINIGSYSFDYGFPSRPLQVEPASLTSPRFVTQVGGVSFNATATPAEALSGNQVSLIYNSSREDGTRLQVKIRDQLYDSLLPDWQLIPIAKYADSEYSACVSLFGEDTNDSAYHIVYHPAFDNTLLGLRLMQADIMFFDLGEFWQLPALNGETILGEGESYSDSSTWTTAASEISEAFGGDYFQSWVLTDEGLGVNISVAENNEGGEYISLGNRPYYYFWKLDGSRVVPVSSLTERIRTALPFVQEYNTAVYGAAMNTMRFSALFRYVKQTNPDSWRSFLGQVSTLAPQPYVDTPTRWSFLDASIHPDEMIASKSEIWKDDAVPSMKFQALHSK